MFKIICLINFFFDCNFFFVLVLKGWQFFLNLVIIETHSLVIFFVNFDVAMVVVYNYKILLLLADDMEDTNKNQ